MRALVAALAFVLSATSALAGTSAKPEAPDAAGDAEPNLGFNDLLAVWVEPSNATLVLKAQVADMKQAIPRACWSLGFSHNGSPYDVLVETNVDGATGATYGRSGLDESNTTSVVLAFGVPATITVAIPTEFLRLAPGDYVELVNLFSCGQTVPAAEANTPSIPGMPSPPSAGVGGRRVFDEAKALAGFAVPEPQLPEEKIVERASTPEPRAFDATNDTAPAAAANEALDTASMNGTDPATTAADPAPVVADETFWARVPAAPLAAALALVGALAHTARIHGPRR